MEAVKGVSKVQTVLRKGITGGQQQCERNETVEHQYCTKVMLGLTRVSIAAETPELLVTVEREAREGRRGLWQAERGRKGGWERWSGQYE